MAGNSFTTHDGASVTGAVAMALDDTGMAVPVTDKTHIGTVRIEGLAVDLIARALAAHAALITGKKADDAYRAISAYMHGASS